YEDKGMTIRYGEEKDLVNLKAQNLFFNNIACYPQKSSEILSDCLVQIITHRPGEGQNQWRWYPYSAVKRAVGKEAVKMLNACARREEKAIPADELIEGIGKLQLSELHPPPQGVSAAQALPNQNLSATNVYPTDSSLQFQQVSQQFQPLNEKVSRFKRFMMPGDMHQPSIKPAGYITREPNFDPKTWFNGTPEEDPNVHSFLKKNSLRPKYFSQYSGFSGDNWLKVEDPDTNTLVWAYVHGLTRKNQLLVEMEGIDGRDYSRCQILPASAYNGERRAYEDKGMTIRYGEEKDLVNLKAQNLFFNNIACYPQKSSEILSDCLVQIITHRPGEGQNQWRWYPYSAVKRAVGKEAVKMLNACARREEKAIPADELIEGIGKLQLSELHPPPQGVSAAQALPNQNLSATNVYPTDSSHVVFYLCHRSQ
ncbi:hypothetical protein JX265_014105, partial [Neoarthrinium moseri]